MKYPKFIKQKDEIALVAPSYGCTFEPYVTRLNKSIEVLNQYFEVICGPNVYKAEVIGRSNTEFLCAEEINYFFQKASTKALLSVGGGELMMEILPYLDFQLIKKNPKWFMGYSDNTNLTYLLPTLCDVSSIYGPNAPSFGITPWHSYLCDSVDLLTGNKLIVKSYGKWEKPEKHNSDDPLAPLVLTEDTKMIAYPADKLQFSGRLLGGCLDLLVCLVGTPFDKTSEFIEKYQKDGIIWFIEACDLNTMAIRRALLQLELAGWFKNVKGFIIGRPLNAQEAYCGLDQYEAVKHILDKYNVPIIFDVDLGHLPPSMPLITGSKAYISLENNELIIDMKLV